MAKSNGQSRNDSVAQESIYHKLAQDLDQIEDQFNHVCDDIKRLGTSSENIVDVVRYQQKLAELYPNLNSLENQKKLLWLNEIIQEEDEIRHIEIEHIIQSRREEEFNRSEQAEQIRLQQIIERREYDEVERITAEQFQQLKKWKDQYEKLLTDLKEQIKRIDIQLNNLFAIKANLEARIEVKRVEVDAWLQNVFQKCSESDDSREINLGDNKIFKLEHNSIFTELYHHFRDKVAKDLIKAVHIPEEIKNVIETHIRKKASDLNLEEHHERRLNAKIGAIVEGIYSDIQTKMKNALGFRDGFNNLVNLISLEKDLKKTEAEIKVLQEERKQTVELVEGVESRIKNLSETILNSNIGLNSFREMELQVAEEIPAITATIRHHDELQSGLDNEINAFDQNPPIIDLFADEQEINNEANIGAPGGPNF